MTGLVAVEKALGRPPAAPCATADDDAVVDEDEVEGAAATPPLLLGGRDGPGWLFMLICAARSRASEPRLLLDF